MSAPHEPLLPEFFPIKLIGAFVAVDFIVGCGFGCSFCISRRHPAREALFDEGVTFETGVTPAEVHGWLAAMPSYRAGVQLRIGHDTDAGLQFAQSAALVERLEPDRSVVLLSRKPLTEAERRWFAMDRRNVLLKLTATPRATALGVTRDPLALVRSTEGLPRHGLHWVVGPLTEGAEEEARRILRALPPGSRLTLKPLNVAGLPQLGRVAPAGPALVAKLEAFALARGHVVTEWFCEGGLARVGQGFFDVDKLCGQTDAARRARDLHRCTQCPSRGLCHEPLDVEALLAALPGALASIGLTLTAPPTRTGPRAFRLEVAEPSSRGDETWLSHALGAAVSFTLSTRERGASEGGSFCNVDPAVLQRWRATGFLPVDALEAAARRTLERLRQRGHPALAAGAR